MSSSLMIQGTGSDVGKSLLCAGLIRAFHREGLRVLPFKPQNMSNNAAVVEGGEIGRAQALQAQAGGVAGRVDMNPILLKPQGEGGSQIIVQGRYWGESSASDYYKLKPTLMGFVEESFERISSDCDMVIVEGAGSPSEVNLRAGDIANMGFAVHFGVPVVLLGDIERGGVIANLVGTYHLLEAAERNLVRAFIVNKFRGDLSLFDSAIDIIGDMTGWSCLGVIPFLDELRLLPQEDSLGLAAIKANDGGTIVIGVLRLPHIANFDDLDALRAESCVSLRIIESGDAIPCDLDLLILAGSKSTILDYRYLCEQNWDGDIAAYVRRGGVVLGLCGGYQMLGKSIHDVHGLEGGVEKISCLGLLDMETVLGDEKELSERDYSENLFGGRVRGYEIHLGQSESREASFLCDESGFSIGHMSRDKRVFGCYVHGLFHNDDFRRNFLSWLGDYRSSYASYDILVEEVLDKLADHICSYCDLDKLRKIAKG